MTHSTKQYRKAQFDKLVVGPYEYFPKIYISASGTNTHCMNITEKELEQIKAILTGKKETK